MVHNGIEYGIMGVFRRGLNILRDANARNQRRTAGTDTAPLRHPENYRYGMNLPISPRCGGGIIPDDPKSRLERDAR